MISIWVTPQFRRVFKKLPLALAEEVTEKIALFENPDNHASLRIHKLSGPLEGRLSFSVNYKYRVVFKYVDKKKDTAVLLSVGDHSVYE